MKKKYFCLNFLILILSFTQISLSLPKTWETKGNCSGSNTTFRKKIHYDRNGDGVAEAVTTVWCNGLISHGKTLVKNNGVGSYNDFETWKFESEGLHYHLNYQDITNSSSNIVEYFFTISDSLTLEPIAYSVKYKNNDTNYIETINPTYISKTIDTTYNNNFFNINVVNNNTLEINFNTNIRGYFKFEISYSNVSNTVEKLTFLIKVNDIGANKSLIFIENGLNSLQNKIYNFNIPF